MTDMVESEVTIGLLREIRDELRSNRIELKAEISEMRTELTSKLDITNARLEVVEHTVNDAASQIAFLGRYLKNRTVADIDDLKLRVSKLEAKLPD
jgi:hypothetical protein